MDQVRFKLILWCSFLALAVIVAAYLVPAMWHAPSQLSEEQAASPVVTIAPATTSSSNAADSYIAAISILQTIQQQPDVDQYLRYETNPFDDQAGKLFAKYGNAAGLVRLAAGLPACDWGDQPVEKSGPLLNGARVLTNFTLMHARYVHLQQHNPTLAMEEIIGVLSLGRRVGMMPRVTNKLIESGIELQAGKALGRLMPALSKDQLMTIAAQLNGLPKSLTPTEVMLGELKTSSVRTAGDQGNIVVNGMANSMAKFYNDLDSAWQQPPDEFAKTVDNVGGKLVLNPMVKTISPTLKNLRTNLAAEQATFAMLITAADILTRGDAAASESRDPFGTGPFQFDKYPGSFNLTSQLQYRGKPVMLIVGGE